jgi:hypothetical protein
MHGVMQALAKKLTQCKEELYFIVKVGRQKLSTHHSGVTATTSQPLMSAHILDASRKVQLFSKWDQGMVVNPDNQIFYTTQ